LPFPSSLPRPRLVALLALAGALLALVAAGCGGGGGNENADPASIAPKSAPLFFTGFVRPEGDQKDAIDSISKKVAGVDDPGQEIQKALDRSLRSHGLNYEDDIKPWIGRRAGVVASDFNGDNTSGAFILATKDKDKTQEAIDKAAKKHPHDKRSYKGVDYTFDRSDHLAAAVVGDFGVLGSETELKRIIDASKGSSLKDNSQYKGVADQAKDKLAFGFVDLRSLFSGLSASGKLPAGSGAALQPLLSNSNKPVTLALDAKSDQVTLEIAGPAAKSVASERQASVIGSLPGDAWAALGLGDVGGTLKRTIDRFSSGGIGAGVISALNRQLRQSTGLDLNRDIIAAIGDVGLFASGNSLLTVGGGAVITSPDPLAARRLVTKLGALIRRLGRAQNVSVGRAAIPGAKGIRILSPKLPGAINLVTAGSKLVVAYGDAATRSAIKSARTLGDNPDFQQASATLGDGATTAAYVSFAPIAQLVSSTGNAQAQRALNALKNAVIGGAVQGDNAVGKVVVNLK
jgi:hypothetical protein